MVEITEEHRKEFFRKLIGYTFAFLLAYFGACHLLYWNGEKGMSLESWYNPFRSFLASGSLLLIGAIAGYVALQKVPKKLALVCFVVEALVIVYSLAAIKMFSDS